MHRIDNFLVLNGDEEGLKNKGFLLPDSDIIIDLDCFKERAQHIRCVMLDRKKQPTNTARNAIISVDGRDVTLSKVCMSLEMMFSDSVVERLDLSKLKGIDDWWMNLIEVNLPLLGHGFEFTQSEFCISSFAEKRR